MTSKMLIHGVVLCQCGGQVISNSGKVFINHKLRRVSCWKCHKTYNIDYAYSLRKENETVTIPNEEDI